ncbi:PREDICTED: uncharacterized protein LOC106742134 isoform X2 [Dinoponera quadriceps]|uniref:Uncharacterized protein LOC106742134 isoform X2 n=1 Tax=Dinoponera quadriceps TaxID=609295 RepID=A0A6P3WWL9_DINQU|nr:PREDICTED: uncharacterized protein LOC106742134 isoform X2 [Dinoponera quadriceps]
MVGTKCCNNVYALLAILLLLIETAIALDCYQCTSEDEWKCMDDELVKNSLMPTNCSHIYGERYCIKSVGRYGGGIGTKRFCSAVHMGNYCDYVKQPGDKLTYRTCVFTCSGDGCNLATSVMSTKSTWIASVGLLVTLGRLFYR